MMAEYKEMQGDTQAIRAYFFKLGLSSEIADVYLALYAYGQMSISELSRRSNVERTRIYRLLDEMQAANIVEVELRYKRQVLRAAPIANLQILLSKKEQELRDLQMELSSLQTSLTKNTLHSEATKVQAYKGVDGLKQMFWNQTRSKTTNLSILYENMQSRTGRAFFERWIQVCSERKIQSRSIISDNFVRTQQDWYKKNDNERHPRWEGRYIPDGIFPITHSTTIYDDVTSYFNWKDGEIFGIEIHNPEIANAQRQFFSILWSQGTKIDDLKFQLDKDQVLEADDDSAANAAESIG